MTECKHHSADTGRHVGDNINKGLGEYDYYAKLRELSKEYGEYDYYAMAEFYKERSKETK